MTNETSTLKPPPEWIPPSRRSAIRHAYSVAVPIWHPEGSVSGYITKREAYRLLDDDLDDANTMRAWSILCVPLIRDCPDGRFIVIFGGHDMTTKAPPVDGHTGRLFAQDVR